jgi:hypothetical protein
MASLSNIKRVPNFVTQDELKLLADFYLHSEELTNSTTRAIVQADFCTEVSPWIKTYTDKVGKKITEICGLDVDDMCGTALRNWYPGEKQDPHSDCEAVFSRDAANGGFTMTAINNFSSIFIEYAALTYLNDDYEGGEIYFPDYDLEIKPLPGELIFFPGTQHYMHGVREVLSGNRYALMTFFTTPKLKYIWKTFVEDQSPMTIIERSESQSMESSGVFTRANMPRNLLEYFE